MLIKFNPLNIIRKNQTLNNKINKKSILQKQEKLNIYKKTYMEESLKDFDIMNTGCIKDSEEIESKANEILFSLNDIKIRGLEKYFNPSVKDLYNKTMSVIKTAKMIDFKTVKSADGKHTILFEYNPQENNSPERVKYFEYMGDKAAKTVKLIGKSYLEIKKFDEGKFEEYIFTNGELYKYACGKINGKKKTVYEDYKYSLNRDGKLISYLKNKTEIDENIYNVEKSYKFDNFGRCLIYRENADMGKGNEFLKADFEYIFDGQKIDMVKYKVNNRTKIIKTLWQ